MHDSLGSLTDADVQTMHVPQPLPAYLPVTAHGKNPADYFRYDEYDWGDFQVPNQVIVPLTQGYFTFITERDREKLGDRKPCAKVGVDRTGELKIRAVLRFERKTITLAQFLMDSQPGEVVEHVNHWPLDNRSEDNLWKGTSGSNNSHTVRRRINIKNKGLPTGVERWGKTKYGAKIQYRGKMECSPSFDTIIEARAWYLCRRREIYATSPRPELNYPIFPPRRAIVVPFDFNAEEAAIAATF